jgi:hypothetical protein
MEDHFDKSTQAKFAFCRMPLHEFLKTDHANHLWVHRGDGLWSRGQPGKMPYEVTNDPEGHADIHPESVAYWKHYGLEREAPTFMEG